MREFGGGAEFPRWFDETAHVKRRKLLIVIQLDPDVNSEEKGQFGHELSAELAQLNHVQVEPSTSTDTPPGDVKATVDWSALLVTFTTTSGVLASVITTVRNWLGRYDSIRSIRLTIDNDSI